MKYVGMAETDVGISKKTNQDSVSIKIAETPEKKQIVMAVMCDGMGGLEKGELASATVVRCFNDWFEKVLPKKVNGYVWKELGKEWEEMVIEQNRKILEFGKLLRVNLGTTLSAMLIMDDKYMIAHVGDSRIYRITDRVEQLTEDQNFVTREVNRGTMTLEQALADPRRNMLLQCVGASRVVEPVLLYGDVVPDSVFMLCTDGFRHVINEQEMYDVFGREKTDNPDEMRKRIRMLINTVKDRGEKDNITAALIKCNK